MLGVLIGGITALAVIVFYGKDDKAVREYKQEAEKQRVEKAEAERKQK